MFWSSPLLWFTAVLAVLRRPRFEPTDRGDMGTAFGLDDSMASLDAPPSRLDDTASPAPGDWGHRSVRRSHE